MADVPYVFGDDGFVAAASSGSAAASDTFTTQNMISGNETIAPPSESLFRIDIPFTDPSSGSST